MSAFLCDRCHLTALAVAAYNSGPNGSGTTRQNFDKLLAENIRSLEYRYRTRWWEQDRADERTGPCIICERTEYPAVEILKAADCYEYQACEHDGYAYSDAHAMIERIRFAAGGAVADLDVVRRSAAYEKASWGLRTRHN